MEPQGLIQLYTDTFGSAPNQVEKLPASGSNRQYYRMDDCIGCIGTSTEENAAFFHLAQRFETLRLPVPHVYAMSADQTCYLQEDLGDQSLYGFLQSQRTDDGHYSDLAITMLHTVMSDLPRFQMEGASEDVYAHCYPQKYFDERTVHFDLNYFKYNFLKLVGLEFNEVQLEDDFDLLCRDLLAVEEQGFMYRDFQARNVMLKENRPYYIDFQGGRRGPVYYDVASFLWQASARYSDELRDELIEVYLKALQRYVRIDKEVFMRRLRLFVFFRTLQVLGAYGYRGLWERKQHFINSIPAALENLKQCIDWGVADCYPYLRETLTSLLTFNNFPLHISLKEGEPHSQAPSSLVVRIYSFSYKSPEGIPQDESGNGGGYVFDCRSTHNPGRYAEYKQMTGLDKPVIDFLEKDGEILTFLDSVYRLADFHVQRYIDRGFTSLMFSFGCTGGQHRSVYSAQHLAEHLHQKFGIEVHLCHREQHIHQILK